MSMILRIWRCKPGLRLIQIVSKYKPVEKFLNKHLAAKVSVMAVPYVSVGSAAMFVSEPEGRDWLRSRFMPKSKASDSQ